MTQPKSDSWMMSELKLESSEGLHARPAIKVSRFARKFASNIQIRLGGEERWVDAKSVAKLIGLHAEAGRMIEIRASGDDADAAIAGLGQFFASDFTELDAKSE